jgi:hypothetical protein
LQGVEAKGIAGSLAAGTAPLAVGGDLRPAITVAGMSISPLIKLNGPMRVLDGQHRAAELNEWLSEAEKNPRERRAKKARPRIERFVIRNRTEVLQYSRILVVALEEVIDYDPKRHHNAPPPELRLEDPQYLADVRDLVTELRRLNALLEQKKPRAKDASGTVQRLGKYADRFAKNYCDQFGKTLGRGSAWLTIGVLTVLLTKAGLSQDVIAGIISHAKIPH